MSRLQNLIMVLWGLALVLFIAFNWSLVNRVVDVSYLFMDFQVKILLWLSLLGFAVPLSFRILTSLFTRNVQRKSEKEITSIKSKAYDGLTGEFDRLGEKLESRINDRLASMMASSAAASQSASAETDTPEEEPSEEDEGKKGKGKKASST